MPIYPILVSVDFELLDMEVSPYYGPITWSDDRQSRANLLRDNMAWIGAHPIRVEDDVRVVVEREIRCAILSVLQDPRPNAEQEVDYESVERVINDDSRITGDLKGDCVQMLRALWPRMAHLLELHYTKHPR